MSSSESSDDEIFAVIAAAAVAIETEEAERTRSRRGHGSAVGRLKYKSRKRYAGAILLDRDYFCRLPPHVHKTPPFDTEFRLRYRVSRDVYERLRTRLLQYEFFQDRSDCTGRQGATTDQKMTAAMRMLATGGSADSVVEYVRLGTSTILQCLKEFSRCVVSAFGDEWLRPPNNQEIARLSAEFGRLGFPGCIGSVDCASWVWDACPIGWQGQCKGKDKFPTLRMEVICDDFLRIWHLNFGAPGAKNDIQIMNASQHFNRIRLGQWPSLLPSMTIEGLYVDWIYYLADGIYPKLRFLMSTIQTPTTDEEVLFKNMQEGVRKGVERVFGVLFKRFNILYRPSRLHSVDDMNNIVKACVILHNMACEERRDNFAGSRSVRMRLDETQFPTPEDFVTFQTPLVDETERRNFFQAHMSGIENGADYQALQKALTNHIWKRRSDIYKELND